MVDHLKQFDKDGKGALSRDELQEAIRGAVMRWPRHRVDEFGKALGRTSDDADDPVAGRERHEELQVGSHPRSPQSETTKPSQSNKLKNDQKILK